MTFCFIFFPAVFVFFFSNVSKYNYCFSDYPFPDDVPDFPHHSQMAKYVNDYTTHFGLDKIIKFQMRVILLSKSGKKCLLVCPSLGSKTIGVDTHYQRSDLRTAKTVHIARTLAGALFIMSLCLVRSW